MYLTRTVESHLTEISKQFRVLLVTGPRQVGKTTMLKHLGGLGRLFVTLDDPVARRLANEDPAVFFQRFPPPVTIDEIQYAPGLLSYIKLMVDEDRTPGRFWLTGSQQFHLMKGISESLAGRIALVNMLGFSRAETDGHATDSHQFIPSEPGFTKRLQNAPTPGLKAIYERIFRGSMPELILKPEMDSRLFFGSYLQTYLQRDVRDLARVGDELAFMRFLRAAAARTGRMINYSDLARDADISPNTAKNWLSILVTSGIVFLLEPWFTNPVKRMIKTPKLYFLDTGLCAYLGEWMSAETLEVGAMSGQFLETFVVTEILKTFWHNGRQAPIYFMRDREGVEIDLLVKSGDTLHPLEIKKTSNPGREDIRHFHHVESTGLKTGKGGVICLCRQWMPLADGHVSIPVTAI